MDRYVPVGVFDVTLGQQSAPAKPPDDLHCLIHRRVCESAEYPAYPIIDTAIGGVGEVEYQPSLAFLTFLRDHPKSGL